MSPNLVAGSASSATPLGSGADTEAGVRAILQQWQEVKTEHGTVERTLHPVCTVMATSKPCEARRDRISHSNPEAGLRLPA